MIQPTRSPFGELATAANEPPEGAVNIQHLEHAKVVRSVRHRL